MDPPAGLLHRNTRVPITRQSRTRPNGRGTHKETHENSRDLDPLPSNRATNIQRMGNIKLAKLNLSKRPRRDRQDYHLDYHCDSTPSGDLFLHCTLGMASNRTEKTPSGCFRRRNIPISLGIPALPSNNYRDWIHHAESAIESPHRQRTNACVCYWRDADVRQEDCYSSGHTMEPSPTVLGVRLRLSLRCRTVLLHTPSPDNQNRSLNHCQRYSVRSRDLYHDVPDKKTPYISRVELLQGENGRPEPRPAFIRGGKTSSFSFPASVEESEGTRASTRRESRRSDAQPTGCGS